MASPRDPSHPAFDLFDDLFHTYDDDDDAKEDEVLDFDDVAINVERQNEIQVIHAVDDNEEGTTDPIIEEQRLSQRLSQLSASQERTREQDQSKEATTVKKRPTQLESTTTIDKKIKTSNLPIEAKIPLFLSAKNKLFDQTMGPIIRQSASSIDIDYLRHMAHLVFSIALNNLFILQWQTYLLSGTGQLKNQNQQQQQQKTLIETPLIWPSEVKKKVNKKPDTTAVNESEIDHITCLNYVEDQLRRLREETEQFQVRLNNRKRHLNVFTDEIEKAIEHFVYVQSIAQLESTIQAKIAIVEYNYSDRIIELEFLHLKPNPHQIRIFQNITETKREHEESKYDVDILKQRAFYSQFPSAFNSLQVPAPLSDDTIINYNTRARLSNRCNRIIQQTKTDLMAVYISAAEAKMHERQHKFDRSVYLFEQGQYDQFSEQRLTPAMVNIMHRRFSHIEERIKRLYHLKVDFFVKAPAATSKKM